MSVLCVVGARPNFVKIAPVVAALEACGRSTVLVHTGQHYDRAMSGSFFEDLGVRDPDFDPGVGSASHAVQTARVMQAFEPVVEGIRPQVVVVVGDVNSTLACALVAAKLGVPVAHVEAGLRSRDWSMPEEINRVVTDRLSSYLLCPSDDALSNLRAEGMADESMFLVGNVMVDSLLANVERARSRLVVDDLGLPRGGYGLVTLHRPANVDDPHVLTGILEALGEIAKLIPLVYPVHPRARRLIEELGAPVGLQCIEPVGYLDSIALQMSAQLVLTDSGGIQEETTVLGIPCLTLRTSTERPITVTEGTNRVVGVAPAGIVAAARDVLSDPPTPRCPPLWDGHAGPRIATALEWTR